MMSIIYTTYAYAYIKHGSRAILWCATLAYSIILAGTTVRI